MVVASSRFSTQSTGIVLDVLKKYSKTFGSNFSDFFCITVLFSGNGNCNIHTIKVLDKNSSITLS